MSNNDEASAKRDADEKEWQKRATEVISKATTVVKDTMSLKVQIADADLKYSEWMAALATAGFALTFGTFEKIHNLSWLCSHPKILNAGLILLCVSFLASIGCSAMVLSLSRLYRAGFNETSALASEQEVLLLNHVKVVLAQAGLDTALLAGELQQRYELEPLAIPLRQPFSLDFIYEDIFKRKGGRLVELGYAADKLNPKDSYEMQQVAQEFAIVAHKLDDLKLKFEEIENEQSRHLQWLTRFSKVQRLLIIVGYAGLLIVGFPHG